MKKDLDFVEVTPSVVQASSPIKVENESPELTYDEIVPDQKVYEPIVIPPSPSPIEIEEQKVEAPAPELPAPIVRKSDPDLDLAKKVNRANRRCDFKELGVPGTGKKRSLFKRVASQEHNCLKIKVTDTD